MAKRQKGTEEILGPEIRQESGKREGNEIGETCGRAVGPSHPSTSPPSSGEQSDLTGKKPVWL